jgi:hypothetical protein
MTSYHRIKSHQQISPKASMDGFTTNTFKEETSEEGSKCPYIFNTGEEMSRKSSKSKRISNMPLFTTDMVVPIQNPKNENGRWRFVKQR